MNINIKKNDFTPLLKKIKNFWIIPKIKYSNLFVILAKSY